MITGQPPFVDDDPMGIYQQILSGKLTFPSRHSFDRYAKSLVKKLLDIDLTQRIGCLKNGVEDIKKHKWFVCCEYNWIGLYNREIIDTPLLPNYIDNDNDTSNFDIYPDEEIVAEGEIVPKEVFKDF